VGGGLLPAEWADHIPTWLRIVMWIAFPLVFLVMAVVVFLLLGYLSALLYSPLYLVRWLRRRRAQVEKPRQGRGCGRLKWAVYLLGIGALSLAVLVGINLASPAVDPCPEGSPGIPPPGMILVVLDVILDECVSVIGDVVSRDAGGLVVERDRGDYVQHVRVRVPAEVFKQVPLAGRVQVAGRIREDEDWGYVIDHGVDRGWWGNLRENLQRVVFTP